MDALIADRDALQVIFAGYKAAAEYYTASNDRIAREARDRLSQSTRGTDTFFTDLAHDLGGIHSFLSQTRTPAHWHDAQRDLHNLLPWLATLLAPNGRTRTEPLCSNTSAVKLFNFHGRILSFKFERLTPAQNEFLTRRIDIQNLPPKLREGIARACKAAVYLQPIPPSDLRDEEDTKDDWASQRAIELCEPLRNAHNDLLGDWLCECTTRHTHVLTSFATPCISNDADIHCVLRFQTNEQWNTVYLDIMDGRLQETNTISGLSHDASNLHEEILSLSKRSIKTARLKFSSKTKAWTIAHEDDGSARQHNTVALAELIVMDGPQALHERATYTHRVALALLIAYAFLELGDSPWLPYKTDHISIWVPLLEESTPDLLHPYIEVGLDNSNHVIDNSDYCLLRLVNLNTPCLPVLGKLIFEVISGRPVEKIQDVENHMMHYKSQYPERASHVAGAVNSCMKDMLFKQGMISEDPALRKAFLECVIHRLHSLLRLCNEDLETVLREAKSGAGPQSFPGVRTKSECSYTGHQQHDNRQPVSHTGNLTSQHCLQSDGSTINFNADQAQKADQFLSKIAIVHQYISNKGEACHPVKVAIIDTGVRFDHSVRNLYGTRIAECRSWLHSNVDLEGKIELEGADQDGHGTHCTSTFLKCATEDCEVYVAQVFASSKDRTPAGFAGDNIRVARAIDYATNVWKVDVISMSFGFESPDDTVEAALRNAENNNVLLIAAASNVGRDMVGACGWPAATRNNVMCIYATEGKGIPYTENPMWRKNIYNFATLGVMVPVFSPPAANATSCVTHRSGTSIATAAAAGVAACVLNFVWRMKASYIASAQSENSAAGERFQRARCRLLKADGMSQVFAQMVDPGGIMGYHFVHPWKLFNEKTTSTTLVENIVNCLT